MHTVHFRWSEKRPPVAVAYEQIRLGPKRNSSKELKSLFPKKELVKENSLQAPNNLSNQIDNRSPDLDSPAKPRAIVGDD